jgi:hypothetical protein
MNYQQRLREARAAYITVRMFKHSSPFSYWCAKVQYLQAIKETELALGIKPRLPMLLRRQAE